MPGRMCVVHTTIIWLKYARNNFALSLGRQGAMGLSALRRRKHDDQREHDHPRRWYPSHIHTQLFVLLKLHALSKSPEA